MTFGAIALTSTPGIIFCVIDQREVDTGIEVTFWPIQHKHCTERAT